MHILEIAAMQLRRLWRAVRLHVPLAAPLDERLAAATIKFVDPNSHATVSGVMVSRAGHFVSCCHLFAQDADWPADQDAAKRWIAERFELRLSDDKAAKFEVLDCGYDRKRYVDYVVGRIVSGGGPFVCVPVKPSKRITGECRVWGYGQAMGRSTPAWCSIVGDFDPIGDGRSRIFQLSSSEANVGGFSGAGVFSADAGGIAGIQIRGVDPSVFPHLGSVVLAFAIRNIATLRRPLLGRATIASWRLEAFAYRLAHSTWQRADHLFAIALAALVLFGVFEVYRLHLTRSMLEMSDTAIQWDSRETARLGPESVAELTEFAAKRGVNRCQAIGAFLVEKNIMEEARNLTARFERAAKCARSGLCFSRMICREGYDAMRRHYNWYHCAFRGPGGGLVEHSLQNVEALLTSGCRSERAAECTALGEIVAGQKEACGREPAGEACVVFPYQAACKRLRTWCGDLEDGRAERLCPTSASRDARGTMRSVWENAT